jgi:ureidoglycolate dehydrogenase (NAD+)
MDGASALFPIALAASCISSVILSTYHASIDTGLAHMDRSSPHDRGNRKSQTFSSFASCVREFAARALEAVGTTPQSATAVAEALTDTSLRGVDSHGIRLLTHYVRVAEHGRVNPHAVASFEETGPGTGTVDAKNGFGHPASYLAIDEAMRLALRTGVSCVSVTHSSHFGAAGCYALRAASQGFVALCTCNSDSFVLPHDGLQPFHGTNPFAFAAPVPGRRPFLLDMATSVIPWNKVQDLRDEGRQMAPDVSVDAQGRPTLDPERSAALLPLGGMQYGYKGAGLAAMAEVLSAALTGMPHCSRILPMGGSDISTPRHLGHFFLVIDPKRLVAPNVYEKGMDAYLSDLRSQPARANTRVMAPGDREWSIEEQRGKQGIPIGESLRRQFEELADRLRIARLTYC